MNVKDIVEWYLRAGEFLGLYDPDPEAVCSCNLDDIAPCTGNEGSDNFHRCKPLTKEAADQAKADAEVG